MADSWFYAHDDLRNGPFTGRQLRDLADAGDILVTDTVWKTGVELGVLATKVKHLFPLVEVKPLEVASVPPTPEPALVPLSPEPMAPVPETVLPAAYKEPEARKKTAMAGKGTIVTGQDGTMVRFKKVCTTCKQVDTSTTSMKITGGTMKAWFFCPTCRKRREVELRGH